MRAAGADPVLVERRTIHGPRPEELTQPGAMPPAGGVNRGGCRGKEDGRLQPISRDPSKVRKV